MLRYALTQSGDLISVYDEQSSESYFCPDCLARVGKKMGPERAWHFFHFDDASHSLCQRHDMSLHSALQKKLLQHLSPEYDIMIEHPIPEARRVADLAIVSQKIAFEIQRSHLSFDALLERTAAYQKNAWDVVWLISSSLWCSSSLPRQLRQLGTIPYYVLHEKKQTIGIWDELEVSRGNIVQRELVHISPEKRVCGERDGGSMLQRRSQTWTLHMRGDFLDIPPNDEKFRHKKKPLWKKICVAGSLLWFRLLG